MLFFFHICFRQHYIFKGFDRALFPTLSVMELLQCTANVYLDSLFSYGTRSVAYRQLFLNVSQSFKTSHFIHKASFMNAPHHVAVISSVVI